MTDIAAHIRASCPHLMQREISPDQELTADLRMDGLDRVTVAMALEEAHGITITDAQIEAWEFVRDIEADVCGVSA